MTKRNFLLGKGERLTERVEVRSGGQPKVAPYTFAQARTRLAPMLVNVAKKLDELPASACPNDRAIASLTLNPEYIAKSYFPSDLLHAAGLTSVGSRPKTIKPEKRSGGRETTETVTTEMFLMGTRSAFRKWAQDLPRWQPQLEGANQLSYVEKLSAPTPTEKLIHVDVADKKKSMVFEIVLHTDEVNGERLYLPKFKEYLGTLGIETSLDKRFYAGGLCFVQVKAPGEKAKDIATFSLVRAIRPMPALRMLRPAIRTSGIARETTTLPTEGPVDAKIRVAVFDGGIPKNHPITKWATPIDVPGVGPANEELLRHGVGVTSAFLFGHLLPGKPADRPFAPVDHYRVIDTVPGQDPYELFEVLNRIQNVLATTQYDFINLSLGPELPIEDEEVHAWTAVLDDHLSDGKCLAAIAVGNGGEGDESIYANRVQVPADCVNALGVGAADSPDKNWSRATYSSVGPGRSPGLIKPDLVAFGGSMQRPFLVLHHKEAPKLEPTGGTSFAAPSALRIGTGVRAHFGTSLSTLAIRTLLGSVPILAIEFNVEV